MSSLFLGCFLFGLLFTVAGFLLGALGGDHLHLPHLSLHGHGGGADPAATHGGAQLSPFNLSIISAFLAWFGGAGYLLTRYSQLAALLVILLATLAGLVGGGIVFVTLSRFVLPRLAVMRAEDYQLPGVVARVTSSIQAGGTGEIVYSLGGTRRSEGARSTRGEALAAGTEVVIVRVEKGIAYVEPWASFAENNQLPRGEPDATES